MAKILLVGGAGYVGSTVAAQAIEKSHDVWILDDFSTGRIELVERLGLQGKLKKLRCGDYPKVVSFFKSMDTPFDCVMHFAAKNIVSESVRQPEVYYENNVEQTEKLLRAMLDCGIRKFIFSSTCAIFGDVGVQPVVESLPKNPLHPYGKTKWEAEKKIEEYVRGKGLQAVSLRYFNACGAHESGKVGEWHEPETHLIPRVLHQIRNGEDLEIFGDRYPTPDGTCIRDYIHVSDIAEAHLSAMDRLLTFPSDSSGFIETFHIGSEKGFSVKEVIEKTSEILRKTPTIRVVSNRPGDVPKLVSDSTRAKEILGYQPKRDLGEIISSALKWDETKESLTADLKKAIFLDRDGTLNVDPGYLALPDQLELFKNAGEGLRLLQSEGFLLVIVTNQSGVGRGLIEEENLSAIHERLNWMLGEFGVKIDYFEWCPDLPDQVSDNRKPAPGMIFRSARFLGIDPSRSYLIGDRITDLEAGRAALVRGVVLVRTGHGIEEEKNLIPGQCDWVASDLSHAADWILDQERKPRL